MNDVNQLASGILAIAFAAVMLVAGEMYIQNKADRFAANPIHPSAGASALGHRQMDLLQ